jgi:hypothetical protein
VARLSKLLEEKAVPNAKYSISDYQKRLTEKQEEHKKAVAMEDELTWEAKKSKEAYEKIKTQK